MSADNILAFLETTDGVRVCSMHVPWAPEDVQNRLYSHSEDFNQSPVFASHDEAWDYGDKLEEDGAFFEYGFDSFKVGMTFSEFYSKSNELMLWRPLNVKCVFCSCQKLGLKTDDILTCLDCYRVLELNNV